MTCQNYTDAQPLNAVNTALLKALIFVGSLLKGRLFQVTIGLGKKEHYINLHCNSESLVVKV